MALKKWKKPIVMLRLKTYLKFRNSLHILVDHWVEAWATQASV